MNDYKFSNSRDYHVTIDRDLHWSERVLGCTFILVSIFLPLFLFALLAVLTSVVLYLWGVI